MNEKEAPPYRLYVARTAHGSGFFIDRSDIENNQISVEQVNIETIRMDRTHDIERLRLKDSRTEYEQALLDWLESDPPLEEEFFVEDSHAIYLEDI